MNKNRYTQAVIADFSFCSNLSLFLTACTLITGLATSQALGQDNTTPNGIADRRQNAYALSHGNIFQANGQFLEDATLLINDGRISEISANNDLPDGYFEIDMQGGFIYPGLIDIYTRYGIPTTDSPGDENGRAENLFASDQALNVNDAIKAHYRAGPVFTPEEDSRKKLRELGFSTVLSFRQDGIARGTSVLTTLGNESANESVIVPDVAVHYSLDKGSSVQSVPSSMMGAIALLRQTYLDAEWFGSQTPRPFTDESLESLLRSQELPQIMEVDNWQQGLAVDRVGDEFSMQYILKTTGDSYKQLDLIRQTGATLPRTYWRRVTLMPV